jgi:hypothetical protein
MYLRDKGACCNLDLKLKLIKSKERLPLWSSGEFPATDPGVLGSISGATRFYEKLWVWNGVYSAS